MPTVPQTSHSLVLVITEFTLSLGREERKHAAQGYEQEINERCDFDSYK